MKRTVVLALGILFLVAMWLRRSESQSMAAANNSANTNGAEQGGWVIESLPVSTALQSADFLTSEDGWAVGLRGQIFHWNGQDWLAYEPSPTRTDLRSIQMLSPNNAWAVGDNGIILHWDGSTWTIIPSGTILHLNEVAFYSDARGWAVGGGYLGGGDSSSVKRILLVWNGSDWQEAPPPTREGYNWELTSIAVLGPDDIWVAGGGDIYSWDGQNWTTSKLAQALGMDLSPIRLKSVPGRGLFAVAAIVDSHGNASGGVVLHWDGEAWRQLAQSPMGLYGLVMLESNIGWAVGGNLNDNTGGNVVLRWDGTLWSEVSVPTSLPLNFVWASSESDGWLFAGGDGRRLEAAAGAILRYEPAALATALPFSTATELNTITNRPTPTSTSSPVPTKKPETVPGFVPNESPPNFWLVLVALIVGVGLTIGVFVSIHWMRRRK